MSSHVVLIGLMGAGKSTVGRVLADLLDVPLEDSDRAIEGSTGHTVAELALSEGVPAMHRREASDLLRALAEAPPTVITAAASTIDDEHCRAALAAAFVVWLRADPSILARRFGNQAHRPSFSSSPADILTRQAEERGARFRELADLELDATADPTVNAERIVAALKFR